ncbi:MAG: 50S ribosomal protein L10 [Sumerlaeia bacterium]
MAKEGKIPTKRRGRQPKIEAVEQLTELFKNGDGIVFVNNKGLSVAKNNELRAKLREAGVSMRVAKNTLIKIAMKQAGIEAGDLEKELVGPTMVAFSTEEAPSAAAKTLLAWLKDNEGKIEPKGALLAGEPLVGAANVDMLSKLPGREEIMVSIYQQLLAPAMHVQMQLYSAPMAMVGTFMALEKKLEGEGSSEAA